MVVDNVDNVEGCLVTEYDPLLEIVILTKFMHVHVENRAQCFVLFSECLYMLDLLGITFQTLMKHVP